MEVTPSAVSAAFEALVRSSFYGPDVRRPGRGDTSKPTTLPPGGLVIMREGDPGEPEVLFSPQRWTYDHRFVLEIAPYPGVDPVQALATMLAPFAAAISADPHLGGLADWISAEQPSFDDTDTAGAPTLIWAELGVVVTYTTANPLG